MIWFPVSAWHGGFAPDAKAQGILNDFKTFGQPLQPSVLIVFSPLAIEAEPDETIMPGVRACNAFANHGQVI
jgi:hypothetical protein